MDTRTQGVVGTLPLVSGPAPARHCVGLQLDDWKLVVGSNAGEGSLPPGGPPGMITVHDIRAAGRPEGGGASRWTSPLVSLPAPGRITCFQVGRKVDRCVSG